MRLQGNRLRAGGTMLAAALLAVAILALPAIGKNGENSSNGPRAAGTIESFDSESGELVVALGGGGTISAKVVRRTQIRCGLGPMPRDHRRTETGTRHRERDEHTDHRGGQHAGRTGVTARPARSPRRPRPRW